MSGVGSNGYILDASTLITPFHQGQLRALRTAKRFKSDIETVNWLENWFVRNLQSRRFFISQEVYEEVCRGKGRPGHNLLRRLDGRNAKLEPVANTFDILRDVTSFVRTYFAEQHADPFERCADPMLIALARSHGLTIITEEKHEVPQWDGGSGRLNGKPRLPFVAFAFDVKCIPLLAALRQLP